MWNKSDSRKPELPLHKRPLVPPLALKFQETLDCHLLANGFESIDNGEITLEEASATSSYWLGTSSINRTYSRIRHLREQR